MPVSVIYLARTRLDQRFCRNLGVAQYPSDACAMKSGGFEVLRNRVRGNAQRFLALWMCCAVCGCLRTEVRDKLASNFGAFSCFLPRIVCKLLLGKQQIIHFGCADLAENCPLYTPKSSETRQCIVGKTLFPLFWVVFFS